MSKHLYKVLANLMYLLKSPNKLSVTKSNHGQRKHELEQEIANDEVSFPALQQIAVQRNENMLIMHYSY